MASEQPTTTYEPFGGAPTQTMNVWEGEHVAYLTQVGSQFTDAATMASIVHSTDQIYQWYANTTGYTPWSYPPTTYDGKDTIAIINILNPPNAAGLGEKEATGVEIAPDYGATMYADAQSGAYDLEHVVIYELGRNFWGFSDQLAVLDPMINGFANANQYIATHATGVTVSPIDGTMPWVEGEARLDDLLTKYLADPNASWEKMLEGNSNDAITVQGSAYSEGDLAGAMYLKIWNDWGDAAYSAFWHDMATLPTADTPEEARDNFVTAAKMATGEEYGWMFKEAGDVVTPPPAGTGGDDGSDGPGPGTGGGGIPDLSHPDPNNSSYTDWNYVSRVVTEYWQQTGRWVDYADLVSPAGSSTGTGTGGEQPGSGQGGETGGGNPQVGGIPDLSHPDPSNPDYTDWNYVSFVVTQHWQETGQWVDYADLVGPYIPSDMIQHQPGLLRGSDAGGSDAVDRNALAAQATANYDAAGHWYL